MKKMESNQMELVYAGTNRQCLIDGVLTAGFIGLGVLAGFVGVAGATLAGLAMANSNGCFDK